MRHVARKFIGAVVLAGALTLTACGTPLREPPGTVGDDYPAYGVPLDVSWPSDWLSGYGSEAGAVGAPIVGLRLEYVDDRWVWRVRTIDPGRDLFGEQVTEPDRGSEAFIDASTREVLKHHFVELTDAELAEVELSAYDAAQLSGEAYPSPRLVELTRQLENGRPVWVVTTLDTENGTFSVLTLDALEPVPE